jgi:hypothetical protein
MARSGISGAVAVKLLRTIRLDRSDTFVFERAAEPGEWAVPGGFMFWDVDPAALKGKAQQAFRSGFLSLTSFGWSTLATVTEATEGEQQMAIAQLARFLISDHGAPDLAEAEAAAREELAFAASLCDHPVGTLIALSRSIGEDGEVRERFRTLKPAPSQRAAFDQPWVRPIAILSEDGSEAADGTERVDLVDLAQREPAGKGGT